ncbi:hypothetical protein [Brevundimonas sp.]|uniref:hypothetical protein n=1 Tax=Brevundimonas sp. TaxID=1871086 RepID=UPI0025BC9236|nr:hypothetical protein [Brevundimonas sp.]
MATGQSAQPRRNIEVSNIAPQVDLRNGEGQMWDQATRVFDRLSEAAKPNQIRRAQARGMEEGAAIAAGEKDYVAPRFTFGDVAAARQSAVETAYSARVRSDVDARERQIRRDFRYDPIGYEQAAKEMVSGFIQGAPPDFAVAVEQYATGVTASGLSSVADARSQRDEAETNQALTVRVRELDERLIALASQPGGQDAPEYLAAADERQSLQQQRQDNPAITYSPEQRALDDNKVDEAVLGAGIARVAVQAYSDAGGGQAGLAAATRFLNAEVLQGEAFKDLTPERRARVNRDALEQVRVFSAADREEKRLQEETERAARAAEREAVGDLRLGILMGEVTESDIKARADLSDTAKAGLINSVRTQERRERADTNRDAQLERTNARLAYGEIRDSAQAGTLSTSEIADALSAGIITQGQARTLQGLNDRALKPIVADVLAPVRDASRRPGMSQRGNAVPMAQAEAHAVTWARANPDATLQQRIEFGEFVAKTVFGGQGAGRPANQQAAQTDQAARLAALSAERNQRAGTGRPMSTREFNQKRNEILHGR